MIDLHVRIFLECDAEEARSAAERIRAELNAVSAVVGVPRIKPYWKMPAYQEVSVDLRLFGDAQQAVARTTSLLGAGWEQQQPCEAIWNSTDSGSAMDSRIRWMHVEVIEGRANAT